MRMQMKTEATRIHNIMKVQKVTITKNVDKCLTLLDRFKQEQNNGNSPLVTQAAREVETFYRKITDQLDELDTNMQRYIDLRYVRGTLTEKS